MREHPTVITLDKGGKISIRRTDTGLRIGYQLIAARRHLFTLAVSLPDDETSTKDVDRVLERIAALHALLSLQRVAVSCVALPNGEKADGK